ncbi:MAG TPA: serine hydrolase domain-containing protein [Solirubrobacterales bacterium]
MRSRILIPAVIALACAALLIAPAAGAATCGKGELKVSTGCVTRAAASRHIAALIHEEMPKLGLRAAIIRVDTGEEPLIDKGFGNSMKGTPASPNMYWRIGSIAIPYLIDVLLQLEDEGKLSLDDKLSKYRPNFPNADEVTLRMLASATSGYPDFIQENQPFQDLLLENPFRQFSANELIHWAFTLPNVCAPGTCFHYAHTNFAILSQVISKVAGQSVSSLIKERVFRPLGLRHTAITRYPAFPGPGLHAYTGERGVYEDATFWSPSWSIGAGTVMTATMGDTVRGFRAMARGALISKRANRERTEPITAHLAPFSPKLYYGLGVTAQPGGWQFQNPFIDGYTGIAAYLPAQDLSLGIATTQLPQSSANGVAYATALFAQLTEYLSPEHVVAIPGK